MLFGRPAHYAPLGSTEAASDVERLDYHEHLENSTRRNRNLSTFTTIASIIGLTTLAVIGLSHTHGTNSKSSLRSSGSASSLQAVKKTQGSESASPLPDKVKVEILGPSPAKGGDTHPFEAYTAKGSDLGGIVDASYAHSDKLDSHAGIKVNGFYSTPF